MEEESENENTDMIPEWSNNIIPHELSEVLFFLYINGLSYNQIAEKYVNSATPFSGDQLRIFAKRYKWFSRKKIIEKEVNTDFTGIIKQSQAKKVSAISLAVQTVSDIIIKDVADYRANPDNFWKEVNDKVRPRPFWLAKNVEELTSLFKLQKFLEEGKEAGNEDGAVSDTDRAAMLKALADAQRSSNITINIENASPQPMEIAGPIQLETVHEAIEVISEIVSEDDDLGI